MPSLSMGLVFADHPVCSMLSLAFFVMRAVNTAQEPPSTNALTVLKTMFRLNDLQSALHSVPLGLLSRMECARTMVKFY